MSLLGSTLTSSLYSTSPVTSFMSVTVTVSCRFMMPSFCSVVAMDSPTTSIASFFWLLLRLDVSIFVSRVPVVTTSVTSLGLVIIVSPSEEAVTPAVDSSWATDVPTDWSWISLDIASKTESLARTASSWEASALETSSKGVSLFGSTLTSTLYFTSPVASFMSVTVTVSCWVMMPSFWSVAAMDSPITSIAFSFWSLLRLDVLRFVSRVAVVTTLVGSDGLVVIVAPSEEPDTSAVDSSVATDVPTDWSWISLDIASNTESLARTASSWEASALEASSTKDMSLLGSTLTSSLYSTSPVTSFMSVTVTVSCRFMMPSFCSVVAMDSPTTSIASFFWLLLRLDVSIFVSRVPVVTTSVTSLGLVIIVSPSEEAVTPAVDSSWATDVPTDWSWISLDIASKTESLARTASSWEASALEPSSGVMSLFESTLTSTSYSTSPVSSLMSVTVTVSCWVMMPSFWSVVAMDSSTTSIASFFWFWLRLDVSIFVSRVPVVTNSVVSSRMSYLLYSITRRLTKRNGSPPSSGIRYRIISSLLPLSVRIIENSARPDGPPGPRVVISRGNACGSPDSQPGHSTCITSSRPSCRFLLRPSCMRSFNKFSINR